MNGVALLPESLGFKLSTQSKDYHLSRTDLLQKIKDTSFDCPLSNDVLKDENLAGLQQLWISKYQSDINLLTNDTVISAHKFILVAASDYFRAMFSGDFAEAGRSEIELQEISTAGLEHILGAIYTGTLVVEDTNILIALDSADKLQVQEIIDACEDFLISGIDATNSFQLLQLSERYTLPRLNRQIELFIISDFLMATQHGLYPYIQSDAVITFVSNDELDCPEIDILKGVLKWLKVNPSADKLAAAYEIMKQIRFTYMTSSEIKEQVMCETIITQNPECLIMIENALKFVTKYEKDVYSRPLMEASNPEKPRGKLSVAVILPEPDDRQEQQLRQAAQPLLFLFGLSSDSTINMRDINVFGSEADFTVFGMNVMQMGNSLFFLGQNS